MKAIRIQVEWRHSELPEDARVFNLRALLYSKEPVQLTLEDRASGCMTDKEHVVTDYLQMKLESCLLQTRHSQFLQYNSLARFLEEPILATCSVYIQILLFFHLTWTEYCSFILHVFELKILKTQENIVQL